MARLSVELSLILFLVNFVILLILWMKIEDIWIYTTKQTKGWEAGELESLEFRQSVERRTNIIMNVIGGSILLIIILALVAIVRVVRAY